MLQTRVHMFPYLMSLFSQEGIEIHSLPPHLRQVTVRSSARQVNGEIQMMKLIYK